MYNIADQLPIVPDDQAPIAIDPVIPLTDSVANQHQSWQEQL